MLDVFRAILFKWSGLCDVFLSLVIIGILYSLYRLAFYGEKIDWSQFKIPIKSRSLKTVVIVLLAIGIANSLLSIFLEKREIGAFYEPDEYSVEYEATVSADSCTVPCIATVSKYDGVYHICDIRLPYGREQYMDDIKYDARANYAHVNMGYDLQWECALSLSCPATSISYSRLSSYSQSSNSGFCASIDSDVYHLRDCRYVQRIARDNLIYFDSDLEAEILGFEICSVCRDRL